MKKARVVEFSSDNPFKESCHDMINAITIECDDMNRLEDVIDEADLALTNAVHSLSYMRAKSWDIVSRIESQNYPDLKRDCASLKEKLIKLGPGSMKPGKMILVLNQLNSLLHKAQVQSNGKSPQKMKVIRGLINTVNTFISKVLSNIVSNRLVDALSKEESKEKKAGNIFEKVSDRLDAVIKTKAHDESHPAEKLNQTKEDPKFKS